MIEPTPGMTTRDVLVATLVILLWGMNFVPMKFALEFFTPLQLGAARFLLTAFPLVFIIPRPKLPLLWIVLYAATQGVGQFGFLFFALKSGMSAALASVLMQMQVFITALLGATLLGETISRPLKLGMVVAGCGLILFAVNIYDARGLQSVTALGFALNLVAAAMWACSNVTVKKIQAADTVYSPLALVAWSSVFSGFSFVLISILFDPPAARWHWLQTSPMGWVCVLYLGWAANALAYWLWATLLTRHPASRVAPFSLGIPVIGLLAGIWLLDEQVSRLQWIGSGLIISALLLVIFGSRLTISRLNRRYGNR